MESLLYICVTILEGVLGVIFFSEEKLSYGAFFLRSYLMDVPFCWGEHGLKRN